MAFDCKSLFLNFSKPGANTNDMKVNKNILRVSYESLYEISEVSSKLVYQYVFYFLQKGILNFIKVSHVITQSTIEHKNLRYSGFQNQVEHT